ncbi:carboxyl transferase domain-containing protein [Embleya sp. NBC_00896]|uniref:carboxyl transferase domain-containing protein n=1 Tax=Embleya sp. NBC_00896 TaxID=2975961 RepID=UPI003867D16B|nr:acetyl-CoA carboxyl transferase [Embleya sp. NBC_00896]
MTTAPAAPTRPNALAFADAVFDPGTFRSWDTAAEPEPESGPYADALAAARAHSGTDESVRTGEARVAGHRVAVLLGEFDFLAGSIGAAAANRLIAAIHRAGTERLPLFAAPVSGGTRMQEGTPAFVRMIDITAAIVAHKAAGLAYLVHLRHPTTGGVLASWGSLGHITTAEPGALIGFLGPRVYEALHGEPFPAHVQRAENLHRRGVLDAVLPPTELRRLIADTLDLLRKDESTAEDGIEVEVEVKVEVEVDVEVAPIPTTRPNPRATSDIWRSVGYTRDVRRPGLDNLLRAADKLVPLSGTGAGERDDAMRLALARIGGTACVVVGHDRERAAEAGPVGPGGLRTARRGIRLAAELGLPLLTVVDTAGAALSPAAEEGALAAEIARCIAELGALTVPTVSLLLGEGAGGAALALLATTRRIATEHAWLAPLPPEGASAILHRTPHHAPTIARTQHIATPDLLRTGFIHRIVNEPTPSEAHFIPHLTKAITQEFTNQPSPSGA